MKLQVLALVLISACSSLTIKDFTFCTIAPDEQGSVCDGFLTNHQTSLTENEWIALSNTGWFAVSADDYAQIKTEIEQACTLVKCSYETTQAATAFFQKVQNAQKKAKTK